LLKFCSINHNFRSLADGRNQITSSQEDRDENVADHHRDQVVPNGDSNQDDIRLDNSHQLMDHSSLMFLGNDPIWIVSQETSSDSPEQYQQTSSASFGDETDASIALADVQQNTILRFPFFNSSVLQQGL
jgi:hypothetical protein